MHNSAGEEHATEEGLHRAVLSQLDVEVDAWQEGGQKISVRLSLRRATGKLDQVTPSSPAPLAAGQKMMVRQAN